LARQWLTRAPVDCIHDAQLAAHGGNLGVLSDTAIESALQRGRDKHLSAAASLHECAAALAFGFAKHHGYHDANRRTAYTASITVLRKMGGK
jgi:death on curing protein